MICKMIFAYNALLLHQAVNKFTGYLGEYTVFCYSFNLKRNKLVRYEKSFFNFIVPAGWLEQWWGRLNMNMLSSQFMNAC